MEIISNRYFTNEELINTPSRKCGISAEKEMEYRQQTAGLIYDIGRRLRLSLDCINTAVASMHRFYMEHSMTDFNRYPMSAACIFFAANFKDQTREPLHVIRVLNSFINANAPPVDPKSCAFQKQTEELLRNEANLAKTLNYEWIVHHPQDHVIRFCKMIRANKTILNSAYFLATNCLQLTTMSIKYKPTVIACFCVYFITKWAGLEIPLSSEGKQWYTYCDKDVTLDQLDQLTDEYLEAFDKCSPRLQQKIRDAMAGRPPPKNATTQPQIKSMPSTQNLKLSVGKENKEQEIKKNRPPPPPAAPRPKPKAEIIQERFAQMMLKKAYQRPVHFQRMPAPMHQIQSNLMKRQRETLPDMPASKRLKIN